MVHPKNLSKVFAYLAYMNGVKFIGDVTVKQVLTQSMNSCGVSTEAPSTGARPWARASSAGLPVRSHSSRSRVDSASRSTEVWLMYNMTEACIWRAGNSASPIPCHSQLSLKSNPDVFRV